MRVSRPSHSHETYMRLAIAQAMRAPKYPFGAVLVNQRDGQVLAEGHNRADLNPTWHGEIDAINRCAARQTLVDWPSVALYTTAEPCPMCQSAILWAGIGTVVYGVSIPFLQRTGWRQIDIRAAEVAERAPFAAVEIIGGVLEAECEALFLAVEPLRP